MSLSLSTSTCGDACRPANKQATIGSYFSSLSNGLKRKRRNLEVLSTDNGDMEETAAVDEQDVDVKKVVDPCQFSQLNDDRNDCLKLSSTLKVYDTLVCSISSEQFDCESSDIIPPSPVAASSTRLNTSCTGRMRRASDEHVATLDVVGADAADMSAAAVLADAALGSEGLSCIDDPAGPSLRLDNTFEDEQETRVADMCRQETSCHFSERYEADSDRQLTVDVPSLLPAAAVNSKMCGSKSPATEAHTSSTSENLPSTRRQFVEKVIIVLLSICNFACSEIHIFTD